MSEFSFAKKIYVYIVVCIQDNSNVVSTKARTQLKQVRIQTPGIWFNYMTLFFYFFIIIF